MSYKIIEYTVYDDKIMPNTLQAGGVAGDDNAVRVKFNLGNITLAADDKVRLEISNGVGGFNSSEHLTISNGCVYYDLPFDVTSAGGTAVLHLVICGCKDNVEQYVRYSYPAKIYFEESGCGSISYKQYKQGLSGLALECKLFANEAEDSAQTANQHLTEAQAASATAKAAADSVSEAVGDHNTSETAHSTLFNPINAHIDDLDNRVSEVSSNLTSHNTSNKAHADIRNDIDTLYSLSGDTSSKAALLQKYPCYEYAASGGAVQRFDDVSVIPHTIGATVHGATDDSGNKVTNPRVQVYGKNLFKFIDKSIDGYIFSGSSCKVKSPTQYYGYGNNPSLLLPAGTYTFSCKVTGSRTYNSQPGFNAFFNVGDTKNNINMYQFVSGAETYKTTFAITEPQPFSFINVWFAEIPTSADLSLDFQLEVGDAATEYEPYVEPQTTTIPMSFGDGEVINATELYAVSPTMTVIASDDNSLISAVDVKYNRDVGKAIAALTS